MIRPLSLLILILAVPVPAQTSQDEFFGLDKIWDVHITVTQEAWLQMFPKGPRSATRLFGKYPYRAADVTIGSHSFEGIGIRMKGNATFAANGGTLKKSLKLDFNRNDAKQKFLGMGKLNLQCNALDRTQIKEAVSYHVYRSCGIVAGRTAFARVFLTIEGKLKRSYLGLYTAVEQVDQRYAKRHLGGGLILKPDGETMAYLGEKWNGDYESSYHPKSEVSGALTQPLIKAASLFDEPDDEVFANGIGTVMDVESFLTYTAATTILINTDSPLTVPDNYYLIVSERTKKVHWVPWDMNWSMGEYGNVTATPTVDLSVMRPTSKEVFRRVLEIPRFRKRYREIVAKYIAGPCSAAAMTKAMHRAHETVKKALVAEAHREGFITKAPREFGGRRLNHPSLRGRDGDNFEGLLEFAKARERSVKEQLAGTAKGRSARNLFGPDARTVRGNFVRDVLGAGLELTEEAGFDEAALDAAVAPRFARADRDGSKSLSKEELAAVLQLVWKATPRRERTRIDLSKRLARRAVATLDTDASGDLDLEEWKAGVVRYRRYWDRDLDGRWTSAELNVRR